MLHYRISTHQYFYFYVTTFECWQYLWIVWHSKQLRKLLFAHSRANKMSCRVPTPALGVLRHFFFFYLVWWHLTLITPKHPDIVPIIPFPRHSCQVRASLSRSTRLIEWASKCLSLFCRDAFITLARTVRRRNRTVPLLSRQATSAVTWDERSERKRKKKKDSTITVETFQNLYDRDVSQIASPKSLPEPILDINLKCSLHLHLYRA